MSARGGGMDTDKLRDELIRLHGRANAKQSKFLRDDLARAATIGLALAMQISDLSLEFELMMESAETTTLGLNLANLQIQQLTQKLEKYERDEKWRKNQPPPQPAEPFVPMISEPVDETDRALNALVQDRPDGDSESAQLLRRVAHHTKRTGKGTYTVCGERLRMFVKDSCVMVRTGGGFMEFELWCTKHRSKINRFMEGNDAGAPPKPTRSNSNARNKKNSRNSVTKPPKKKNYMSANDLKGLLKDRVHEMEQNSTPDEPEKPAVVHKPHLSTSQSSPVIVSPRAQQVARELFQSHTHQISKLADKLEDERARQAQRIAALLKQRSQQQQLQKISNASDLTIEEERDSDDPTCSPAQNVVQTAVPVVHEAESEVIQLRSELTQVQTQLTRAEQERDNALRELEQLKMSLGLGANMAFQADPSSTTTSTTTAVRPQFQGAFPSGATIYTQTTRTVQTVGGQRYVTKMMVTQPDD